MLSKCRFLCIFLLSLLVIPAIASAQDGIQQSRMPESSCESGVAEIIYIIDQSGSMSGLEEDVVGGYNAFVKEQRSIKDKKVLMTTVFFSSEHYTRYDAVNVKEVELKSKDYSPGGSTALYDAIGDTLTTVSKRLSITPIKDRPCKVIVVIMTDGEENASRNFTDSKVKGMIEEKQKNAHWEFLFYGANIDAYAAGGSIGIKQEHRMEFKPTKKGVRRMNRRSAAKVKALID